MKIKNLLGFLCLGMLFAACNNETVQQPSGLEGQQSGSSIELTWNAVENAVSYDISRNGDYLATTNKTRYVDNNPEDGENLYEVMAFDGQNFSKATSVRVMFDKPSGGDNPGGGDETPEYYIKHPWGTGQDADWSWQPMKKQSAGTYIYDGSWGGVGANINTKDDDENATWFPSSSIDGASNLSIGDNVRFVYYSSSKSLSVSSSSGGGENPTADYYIKHPWGTGRDADWSWQPMVKNGNRYEYTGAWGAKGANINTKADDAGAYYYPLKDLDYTLGALIKFEYEPSTEYLYTTPVNNGGGDNPGGDNPGGGGDDNQNPPETPTGLKASLYSDYVLLTWNASKGAQYYQVWRMEEGDYFITLATDITETSYKDKKIEAGKTYTYKVVAAGNGWSDPSNAVKVNVPSSGGSGGGDGGGGSGGEGGGSGGEGGGGSGGGSTNDTPCPPSVTCQGTSSVTVRWDAVTGSGCGVPKKYDVKRNNPITGVWDVLKSGTTSTSYTDSKPFPGKTLYGVTAINDYGEVSNTAKSESVGITAPSISGSIYGSTHALDISVKDLDVPDDWKPYYQLQLFKSTSSSGPFNIEHQWKYDETIAHDYSKKILTYEIEYPTSVDLRGQSYYIKLRWIFAPNSYTQVEGKETSSQKVTHK